MIIFSYILSVLCVRNLNFEAFLEGRYSNIKFKGAEHLTIRKNYFHDLTTLPATTKSGNSDESKCYNNKYILRRRKRTPKKIYAMRSFYDFVKSKYNVKLKKTEEDPSLVVLDHGNHKNNTFYIEKGERLVIYLHAKAKRTIPEDKPWLIKYEFEGENGEVYTLKCKNIAYKNKEKKNNLECEESNEEGISFDESDFLESPPKILVTEIKKVKDQELERAVAVARANYSDKRLSASAKQNEMNAAEEKLNQTKAAFEQANSHLVEAEKQQKGLSTRMTESETKINQIKKQLTEQQGKLTEVINQFDAATSEIDQLKEKSEPLREELKQAKAEEERLTGELNQANAVNAKHSEVAKLRESLEQAQQKLIQAQQVEGEGREQGVNDAQAEVNRLTAVLAHEQQRLNELQPRAANGQVQAVNDPQAEVNRLIAALEQAKGRVSEAQKKIEEVPEKLMAEKTKFDQAKEKRAVEQAEVDRLTAVLNQEEEVSKQIRAQFGGESFEQFKQAQAKKNEAEKKLNKARKECFEKQRELSKMQAEEAQLKKLFEEMEPNPVTVGV